MYRRIYSWRSVSGWLITGHVVFEFFCHLCLKPNFLYHHKEYKDWPQIHDCFVRAQPLAAAAKKECEGDEMEGGRAVISLTARIAALLTAS